MFCWFICQISDVGIALTTTSHQQPKVTPVIRFKIQSDQQGLKLLATMTT
jgi:hypothetical protein